MNSFIALLKQFCDGVDRRNAEYTRSHTIYNTAIGWNGFCYQREFIQDQFVSLKKYFREYAFDNVSCQDPRFYVYNFRVLGPNDATNFPLLRRRCKEIAEVVLLNHLRDNNYWGNVDGMIGINLKVNVLQIIIARTPDGVDVIQAINKKQRL